MSSFGPPRTRPGAAQDRADYFSYRHPGQLALAPASPRRVLDVGCGFGEALLEFRRQGATKTIGIEVDADAARDALARPEIDRVLVGDVEQRLDELAGEQFDLVIVSHVLEHLVDPWAIASRLTGMLAPGGSLLGGVPNIRHAPTVGRLLVRGRWQYADAGILDRTHLRFFTRSSLAELLAGAGLTDIQIRPDFGASHRARRIDAVSFGRLSDLWAFAYDFCGRVPTAA